MAEEQWWLREDKTPKGSGFFGVLPMQDGSNKVATEISLGFDYGNGETLVPALNPYLTEGEKLHLLQGKEITPAIREKTGRWGYDRLRQGMNPFIQEGEKVHGNGLAAFRDNLSNIINITQGM